MKSKLEEIDRLARAGQYDDAVVLIDAMDQAGFTSSELQVIKGDLIQLGESELYSIEDAAAAYVRAIDLDAGNIKARLELGWFRLNVEDDAVGAKSCFDTALELSTELRNESRRGLAECRRESQ